MRVAYANVRDGALCLGDPGGRHVRLLVDGVDGVGGVPHGDDEYDAEHGFAEDDLGDDEDLEPDEDGDPEDLWQPRGLVAWGDLAALEIDAPTTRWRYPGVLSTVVAAVVGTVGIEWFSSGAELDVEITTGSGVAVVRCDGFAGRGYWAPHARAVEALLRLLLWDPTARAWLDTPADLLAHVTSVARSGPTDQALVDELRVLLAPGPRRG